MLGTEKRNKQKRFTDCVMSQKPVLRTRVPLWLSPHSTAFIESMHQIFHCSFPYRHPSLAIVNVVSDPTTDHSSSPVFAFLCNRAHPHLTPQHWLLCHLA